MLPFALKVVWFVLCATGTISSWLVLIAMAKALELYWFTMAYCIAITLLEGIVCLGMVYRMNPFQMPQTFRYAQIAIITFSALVLVGICVTFITATTLSVLLPFHTCQTPNSTLAWRTWYLIPIVGIPTICTIAQTVLVIKLDAAGPSDNLHAEITGSLWLLLLGYVGVPLVESIPCFIITSLAATRIAKMRKLEMKNRHRPHSNSVATQSVPSASSSIPSPVPSQGQVPFHTSDSNLYLESPSAARFHVTIRSDVKSNHLSDSPTWETSFPQSPVVLSLTDCVDEINESQQSSHTVHRGSNTVHVARENDPEDNASSFRSLAHSDEDQTGITQARMLPLLWRLILFHALFFVIQILTILSPLIGIGRGRRVLSPFGTQHVALILAGWAPVIVFSHSPAIRKYMVFWEWLQL